VFPIRGSGAEPKAPRQGWLWAERNTADQTTARRWLDRASAYGIACGPSRLVVIDLDQAKPGSRGSGRGAFAALCQQAGSPWPVTYTVATPSGGLHLYFRADPQRKITNAPHGLPSLIDVRGAGGYVVGAGSVIPGGSYQVQGSVLRLAPLPPWLGVLLTPPERGQPTAATPQVTRPGSYAQAALAAEAARVAAHPEPGRNVQLNLSAWTLARFPESELPAGLILSVLGDAAQRAGLAEPEIGRTIRSGLRRRGSAQ
jgi:hypothetical protein